MIACSSLLLLLATSPAAARDFAAGWPRVGEGSSGQLMLRLQTGQTQPPAAPPEATDDFDLLPPIKPPDAAALARQAELTRALSQRRTMLRLHQVGGLATMATMAATVVLGQLNYMDKYGGGGDTGRYSTAHKLFAYGTSGVFAATGLLALLAPSPFETPLRLDTATLHKAAMVVATAGMATQIVLGIVTSRSEGRLSQRDFALAHQIVGYTTLAATTAGFVVLAFN
jgi:hypothetical protein